MKHLLLATLLSFVVDTAVGQLKQLAPNPFNAQKVLANPDAQAVRGMSPTTAFLILDLKKTHEAHLSHAQLKDKYALIEKDGKLYANTIIHFDTEENAKKFQAPGLLINLQKGKMLTALVPLYALPSLSKNAKVMYLEVGEKVQQTMDAARTVSNVNQVHAGTSLPQPYFGEGVVIGIIDGGFDYTHPNFYNSTGMSDYRIKRVWEQNATSGTPPSGFSYGRELATSSAILSAQRDEDNASHGTHVAGIAAGAGGGASTTFMGVAPGADLVFVSTDMSTTGILDGIAYIQGYAASVGKPCVINMSLGGHMGPHDGTSTFDNICDEYFVGEGRILVGSAGNEGEKNIYLGKTYTTADTQLFTFLEFPYSSLGTNGASFVDIWGNVGDNFYAGVYIYDVYSDLFVDATTYLYGGSFDGVYEDTLYDGDFWGPDPCFVYISTGIDPNNGKPRATIMVNNYYQDDNYHYVLIEVRAFSTQTKMWTGATFSDLSYGGSVLSGTSTSTVGEVGGTGNNMISVGAYTSKNTWTAFSGSTGTADAWAPVGAIAPFSSKGPTADGRVKPDITAPGNVNIASVSRFDGANYPPSSSRVASGVTDGSNTWYFGAMEGTSMSAPTVTGIIALWLEMYPDLSPNQVKDIFQSSAITDAHTGTIGAFGSNTWGRGKINAWVNLSAVIPPKPNVTPSDPGFCAGGSVTLTAPSGYTGYIWSNGATTPSITVSTAGTYSVKVTNGDGYNSPWSDGATVTIYPTPPVPTITRTLDTLVSSATSGNQWYKNGTIISGATNRKYTLTSPGTYKVVVTNTHGCTKESAAINTSPTSLPELDMDLDFTIYPNPTHEILNIKFGQSHQDMHFTLYDISGKKVIQGNLGSIQNGETKIINLESLPAGNYNLNLNSNHFDHNIKVTVSK